MKNCWGRKLSSLILHYFSPVMYESLSPVITKKKKKSQTCILADHPESLEYI